MKKPHSALTRIEVALAGAVLLLLSALLFGALSRVREVAHAKEERNRPICVSNQKQILRALQLYRMDAAGHFPLRDPMDLTVPVWIDVLMPYTRSPQVWICPSATDGADFRAHGTITMGKTGQTPRPRPTRYSDYLANGELLLIPWGKKFVPAQRRKFVPLALADVASPATTIFLSDGAKQALPTPPYWTNARGGATLANTAAGLEYILRTPAGARGDGSYGEAFAPNPRHNGRAIVGFVDGHAEAPELSKWYFPQTPYLDPSRGG